MPLFIFASEGLQKERLLFPKTVNLKKKIYLNQIVPLKVNLIVAADAFDKINTDINNSYGVKVLDSTNEWIFKDDNTFYTLFYLKIQERYVKFPDINISLMLDGDIIDTFVLKGERPEISTVEKNDKYCLVLADSLEVVNSKIKKYDNENNILALEIQSTLGNLEDFSLPFAIEEGIDWVKISPPKTTIFYYAIFSNAKEKIIFNYFNTKQNEFRKIKIDLDFSQLEQKTSTQIEINPKKNSFPYFETIIILLLNLLFFILFWYRKKVVYLILIVIVLIIYLFYFEDQTITVKKGAKLYLLPTKNSSIFFKTRRTLKTKFIKKRNGYYKILLPNGKVGWVKKGGIIP